MQNSIPLSKPWLTRQEVKSVGKAIKSGWLTQNGSSVKQMENSLSEFLNPKSNVELDVTSTFNGTNALHLALISINLKPGDEVIIPNFCYIAVVNSVLYCGALPILVDIELDSWNIDMEKILNAMTSKTKAIIFVDNYGRNCDYSKIKDLIPSEIKIIRDAAESFPGKNADFITSDQVDLTTFSFYANKVFTSGEGGAVFGKKNLIEQIKSLKNHSLAAHNSFSHNAIGYNYRITNLQAAIFNSQWSRRARILKERQRVFRNYSASLLQHDLRFENNSNDNPWLFTMRIPSNLGLVEEIRKHLNSNFIETRPGFTALSKQSFLLDSVEIRGGIQNSLLLAQETLSLPTFPQLSAKSINRIINIISKKLLL